MKRIRRSFLALIFVVIGSFVASAGEIPHWYKKTLDIRLPRVQFTDARIDEVIEFMRIKSKDLDPEKIPELSGINILLNADPERIPRISYDKSDITFGEVLADLATLSGLEIHLADHAIVVQPPGRRVYPINSVWAEGRVHHTYRPAK